MSLPAPDPRIPANGVIARRPQVLEQADQRQPLACCGSGVLRQQPVQLSLPTADLGASLNLPPIRERGVTQPQHLPNRLRDTFRLHGISLIDLPLTKCSSRRFQADRLHNHHPSTAHLQPKQATQQAEIRGVDIARRNTVPFRAALKLQPVCGGQP